jgi:dienelactone hydrolase
MGAPVGDLDDVSRPLRLLSAKGGDAAAEQLFAAWTGLADKLARQGAEDEAKGRRFSAGAKYKRVAIFYVMAERMQRADFAPRTKAYGQFLAAFAKYIALSGEPCRRVEVPYKGASLPALFVPAEGASAQAPAPCMIHFDGLDVMKEIIFMMGMAEEYRRRGISTLIVDNPGVGESLRLRGLNQFPEAEVPAAAVIDYLEQQPEVDAKRIGIAALSLGGFHAPRAAAFEPRLACCVAWGANYDWGKIQRGRWETRHQSLPVPHYWEHVAWVLGTKSVEETLAVSDRMTLRGILDRIRCPILVTHGENDRQISVDYARQTVAECVNSPKADLHVHTLADGGAEHCSLDNVFPARELIADWVAETLGARTG